MLTREVLEEKFGNNCKRIIEIISNLFEGTNIPPSLFVMGINSVAHYNKTNIEKFLEKTNSSWGEIKAKNFSHFIDLYDSLILTYEIPGGESVKSMLNVIRNKINTLSDEDKMKIFNNAEQNIRIGILYAFKVRKEESTYASFLNIEKEAAEWKVKLK